MEIILAIPFIVGVVYFLLGLSESSSASRDDEARQSLERHCRKLEVDRDTLFSKWRSTDSSDNRN